MALFSFTIFWLLTPLIYGATNCKNGFECAEQNINISEYLNGYGYKSLFGSSVTVSSAEDAEEWDLNWIYCAGSFSCNSISSITNDGNTKCHGSNSCANIQNAQFNDISCSAASSCQHTLFNSVTSDDNGLKCSAFLSCANAQIRNTTLISATGAYSLFNATIYSSPGLAVDFSGYNAAYGAKIHCHSGHTITISCHNNGCRYLKIECFAPSHAFVFPNGDSILPLSTNQSQSNITGVYNALMTTVADTASNDKLCLNASNLTRDDSGQSSVDIYSNNDAPVCCRGVSSCQTNIYSTTVNQSPVICSGWQACKGTYDIQSVGSVLCSAFGACAQANIQSDQSVLCLAQESCQSSNIYSTPNIHCAGEGSCSDTTIVSNGTDINLFLSGALSGENMNMHCSVNDTCFVYCDADDSCSQTTTVLQCDGVCEVHCTKESGCPQGFTYSVSPTQNPSDSPTTNPSKYPTQSPVSINPTLAPTIAPTIAPVPEHIGGFDDSQQQLLDYLGNVFLYGNIALISLFLLITITGYIDSKYFRINDVFTIGKIMQPCVHTLDTLSDVFLCWEVGALYSISEQNSTALLILIILMIIFILIPMVFSLFQLALISNKYWINSGYDSNSNMEGQQEFIALYMINSAAIKVWFEKYVYFLYGTSIITGSSFSATSLFNSNLYLLPIFDMGLSESTLSHFKTKRVYSIVLCENIPQLILQFIYWNISKRQSEIAVVSMVYSGVSILVTVISIYTQRRIIYMQKAVLIRFDICDGSNGSIARNSDKLRNRLWGVRREFSKVLGVHKTVIEVNRPENIPNGIQMTLLVKVDGNVEAHMQKFEKLLDENEGNKSVLNALKIGWKCDDVTADDTIRILNMDLSVKESKKAHKSSMNQMHSTHVGMHEIHSDQELQSGEFIVEGL